MAKSIEKIIDLIKKTGDKCIILDAEGQPQYVIMSFDDYEKLISAKMEVAGLTEDELLDKINRDIANWKSGQEEEKINNWQPVEETPKKEVKIDDSSLNLEKKEDKEDKYDFEPID